MRSLLNKDEVFNHSVACNKTDFLFSDMFLAAGENLKAIELIGQHGWVEK